MMIVIVPISLGAQGTDRAMLHNEGGVWLDGSPAPSSTAIFPDSVVQTQRGSTAKLDAEGSAVTVLPETIVQFQPDELVLDHGHLQLSTARALRVRVNCITVVPITNDRTQFDVIDVDGKVRVIAYTRDVRIHARGTSAHQAREGKDSDSIVRQGEQSVRNEHCGVAAAPEEVIDAKGAILSSWPARGVGLALVGGALCFAFCHLTTTNDPVSPSAP